MGDVASYLPYLAFVFAQDLSSGGLVMACAGGQPGAHRVTCSNVRAAKDGAEAMTTSAGSEHNTMIRITPTIALSERELEERFIRAAGPGGQNVNKVATAVQLRFDVEHSPSLPEAVRSRLHRLAGRRMTVDGVLVIEARRYRTQERNRQDALDRLVALIQKAAQPPKPRKPTRPTLASKRRRLERKRQRAETKRARRPIGPSED